MAKSVFALDGIFGLPRKKSAGTSFRPPLFGDLFFADQVAVDQFVQEHEVKKPGNIKEVRMSCCWKTYTIFKNCMEF